MLPFLICYPSLLQYCGPHLSNNGFALGPYKVKITMSKVARQNEYLARAPTTTL